MCTEVLAVAAAELHGRGELRAGDQVVARGHLLQVSGDSGEASQAWGEHYDKMQPTVCRYIAAAQARSLPGKPDVKFTKAGTLRNVELNIMNLRRGMQVRDCR